MRRVLRTLFVVVAGSLFTFYVLCCLALLMLRWVDPPTTVVQIERRVGALLHQRPYHKRYEPLPLESISPDLQHAVIAAEDARFYQHHGIDWKAVQQVVDEDLDEGRIGRGGSTITQQLVKNLFLTTSRSWLRKGLEFGLAPVAEGILGKQRILTLYLNVIEWGPDVYGAEAAARYHYAVPAARLSKAQAARLAAIVPNPRHRKPIRMTAYANKILTRMRQMGW